MAIIAITNYGSDQDIEALQENLLNAGYGSGYQAARHVTEKPFVYIELPISELSDFFSTVADDANLNWIEYTVQLEQ